jgi:FlaA1/EpsC-like NDP-sugar epimerase
MKAKALGYFEDKKINNIVIFGSSALATTLIGSLSKKQLSKVKLVVDNDTEKQNKYLCGSNFKISHPQKILNISYDLIFITSHFFSDQIITSLKSLGIDISKVKSI